MDLKENTQNYKKQVGYKWSQALYEANIPTSIVPHPTYIEAMKTTNKAKNSMQTAKLSRNAQKITWQLMEQNTIPNEFEDKTFIHKYGCTICLGGYVNVFHMLLMNFMQICERDNMLLGPVDTTHNIKDIDYVTTEVKQYILQMCFDNVWRPWTTRLVVSTSNNQTYISKDMRRIWARCWRVRTNHDGHWKMWIKQRMLSNISTLTSTSTNVIWWSSIFHCPICHWRCYKICHQFPNDRLIHQDHTYFETNGHPSWLDCLCEQVKSGNP